MKGCPAQESEPAAVSRFISPQCITGKMEFSLALYSKNEGCVYLGRLCGQLVGLSKQEEQGMKY